MYTERQLKAIIKDFSINYKLGTVKIENYYFTLIKYPFFMPDETGMNCLEKVCQYRAYAAGEIRKKYVKKDYIHTVDYAINDAIYSTYSEKSLEFLSDEYKEFKGLDKQLKLSNNNQRL